MSVVDFYLDLLLSRGAGERRKPVAERISFSKAMRERIASRQEYRCMYCGVRLEEGWHLDHIFPISHGGDNEPENLQALCAPCNMRKGVQTDDEYRHRYRKVLPRNRNAPPRKTIPQWRFHRIMERTELASSTRSRKRTKYRSPFRKALSGSFNTAVICAALIAAAMFYMLGQDPEDAARAIVIAVVVAAGVFLGLMSRAAVTNRLKDHSSN